MKRTTITGYPARFYLLMLFFLLAVAANAQTEEMDLPSVVTVSAGYDNDDASDFYIDANIGLFDGQRLLLSAGKINLSDDSTINSGFDPLNFLIGLQSGAQVSFPVGVELEYWGEDNDFEVEALRGSLGYNHKNFSLNVYPQIREFNIAIRDRNLDFSSQGITLDLGLSFIEDVYFSLKYSKHNYSETEIELLKQLYQRNPFIANYIRIKLINTVGLQEEIYAMDGSYYFSWGEVGAYWLQSHSAIDENLINNAVGVNIGVYVLEDWSVDLQVGTQYSDDENLSDNYDFYFGTVSLSYFY